MAQAPAPTFDDTFHDAFATLLRWRRDVRRFRPDPVPEALIETLLRAAHQAPSVGNSQPWRFVRVRDAGRLDAIVADFQACNARARSQQPAERQLAYGALKVEGLRDAPVQMAVFCDDATAQGHGLGQATMPETRAYSVVLAIHTLWLVARAHGLGVGWVSILSPDTVTRALDVPEGWRFVAWLCIGWPDQALEIPELETAGWQARAPRALVLER
ncbi:5,6-dimethylbenzimidazole synthase [Pararhodospirillum oryzae]|uniref:5,6-dimethylbenzimidazole synthase n=1 Tax=Pararhodospirillum oryzae TaxID=478448 RepID=A0A512H6W7_9PROT|nr:5,6-dimethylbenzimidazole synthase [Pararhodospirillum oryzae]GEO81193.1 5,6-dimethylbenzimidazole synthase [Pararhodospirillum oryzae]